MTMRRTAAFFCLGVVIVVALVPAALIATPLPSGTAGVGINASGVRPVEIDVAWPPLLTLITPCHLARAALPSFAG